MNINKKNVSESRYLPVFIDDIPSRKFHFRPFPENSVSVLIVSRISFDFKYYSIVNTLNELNNISKKYNICIKVMLVGNGDAFNSLKKYCINNFDKNELFDVELLGFVPIEEVKKSLYCKVDLAIGMGTSVLDSGAYGIPTIISDISLSMLPLNYNLFMWLHNATGFRLGGYTSAESQLKSYSLDYLFNELIMDKKGAISKKSYDYVVKNHSCEKIMVEIKHILCSGRIDEGVINEKLFRVLSANKWSEDFLSGLQPFLRKFKMFFNK